MSDWPERVHLRDTKLHDDLGGLGQRIFTTAGQGYEKQEYVRGDLYDALTAENKALRDDMRRLMRKLPHVDRAILVKRYNLEPPK
jgi:hypothetical protein